MSAYQIFLSYSHHQFMSVSFTSFAMTITVQSIGLHTCRLPGHLPNVSSSSLRNNKSAQCTRTLGGNRPVPKQRTEADTPPTLYYRIFLETVIIIQRGRTNE